jgi:hypothetical protein
MFIEGVNGFALLHADEAGHIPSAPGDYADRKGATGVPIVKKADVCSVIPVCHVKIHTFAWFIKLMVRENSHQLWHQSHAPVRFTPEQKKDEKEARAEIKAVVMKELGINIGDASDMLTGNQFFKFSEARDFFAGLLHDETKREDFKEIHLGMCSIVRVLNTQRRKVDMAKLRFLGNEIYMLMAETFPWAAISTSLHRVLGHGWEVVEISGGKGHRAKRDLKRKTSTSVSIVNTGH